LKTKSNFAIALLFSSAMVFALLDGCASRETSCAGGGGAVGARSKPPASQAEKMAWFDEARFGMFIHWGIYSVPAGEWNGQNWYGEWFQLENKMPAAQYAQFAAQFNPAQFDARAWVKTARDAGMKYIVITSKHHDGFCMFDTKLSDYNVVQATPWHHDPMKDLAEECHRQGVRLDFYYSVPDWHSPDFPQKYSQHQFHGAPNPDADLDRYVAYVKGQLHELLTQYGPIGILWFDDGGSFEGLARTNMAALMHAQEIIDEIHQLQPWCIVNNRLGLPADYGTPEQYIPGGRPQNAFEVCMTLNDHWGYNRADQKWKSAKVVIQNLADIASKGGNYLLNVGPTPQGTLPPEAVKILGQVGDWMRVNGDSIYGTSASPLPEQPSWGRVTQKGNKLYLHVFDWPVDGKLVIHLPSLAATKAYLPASRQKLNVSPLPVKDGVNPAEVRIDLPGQPVDPVDSGVVLETRPVSATD
jgi:alpha-L-fucosidase